MSSSIWSSSSDLHIWCTCRNSGSGSSHRTHSSHKYCYSIVFTFTVTRVIQPKTSKTFTMSDIRFRLVKPFCGGSFMITKQEWSHCEFYSTPEVLIYCLTSEKVCRDCWSLLGSMCSKTVFTWIPFPEQESAFESSTAIISGKRILQSEIRGVSLDARFGYERRSRHQKSHELCSSPRGCPQIHSSTYSVFSTSVSGTSFAHPVLRYSSVTYSWIL